MALVDKSGRLVKFTLKPGNAAENLEFPTLLDGVLTSEVIADKANDTNAIRNLLASRGIVATIPFKSNRRVQLQYNSISYKDRHLVENFFADLKHFRGIATRYCKLADSFVGLINLAAWVRITGGPGRKPRSSIVGPEQIPMLLRMG